jgi:hypothetical protein
VFDIGGKRFVASEHLNIPEYCTVFIYKDNTKKASNGKELSLRTAK